MSPKLPLLLASALLAPAVLLAASFEGTVSMKLTGEKNSPPVLDLSIKGARTRIDIEMQGQAAAIVMDGDKKQMTMLMPQQQMFMTQPLDNTRPPATGAEGKEEKYEFTAVGTAEKILGLDCRKYVLKTADSVTEAWLTDQLGSFMGLSPGGSPMGPGAAPGSRVARAARSPAWEDALRGKDLFPLRVVVTKGGKETSRMEATAVEKKSLPDSLFAPPAGWQDMGAMMRGMGMPGMRPPGGG